MTRIIFYIKISNKTESVTPVAYSLFDRTNLEKSLMDSPRSKDAIASKNSIGSEFS